MNIDMGKKKNILLLHSKETIQSNLSQILTELNSNVISPGTGDVDKSIGNIKNIDFLIVDLELPDSQAITLIRQVKKINPRIKIITMCDRITNPLYTRMKTLGVNKILERPLKKSIFKEAVENIFMGKDTLNMSDAGQQIPSENSEHFYILVASVNNSIYRCIHEIGFSEGYEIYLSMSENDFISKIQIGFYNVVFSSYSFMVKVLSTQDINSFFLDGVKPALILLDDRVDNTESDLFSLFPVVNMLPQTTTKEEIIYSLHDSILKMDKYVDTIAKKTSKIYIEDKNALHAKAGLCKRIIDFSKNSFLLFYISIIFIIALIGFLISSTITVRDEIFTDNPEPRQQERMDELSEEQIEKFKKNYYKSRGNQ